MRIRKVLFLSLVALLTACTSKKDKQEVWIYTSLYKDTIADIQPKLEKQFPDFKFNFFQAGSEEVAAKVTAENIAGKIKADLLISSDRFWYEDMARQNKLHNYKPIGSESVDEFYKHKDGFYTTVSYPVMVIAYNKDAVAEKDKPKSFKELSEPKWKSKVSSGSPLSSGTAFTTMAFLKRSYGIEFFKNLRTKNDFIAEGGNSGVIRRLQSKERPVGIVLLENVLRLTESDPRIQYIIPEDGAVIQSNVLALVKNENSERNQKIADWFFAQEGQTAMSKSFMYPAVTTFEKPKGAPDFSEIKKSAKLWDHDFIENTLKNRESFKEEFTKIMF